MHVAVHWRTKHGKFQQIIIIFRWGIPTIRTPQQPKNGPSRQEQFNLLTLFSGCLFLIGPQCLCSRVCVLLVNFFFFSLLQMLIQISSNLGDKLTLLRTASELTKITLLPLFGM
jgi:hypothetical protein